MTTTHKTVLGSVVLAALLALAFYAYSARQAALTGTEDTYLPTEAGDTSDDALEQDAAAIDAELAGLDEDSAVLEESLEVYAEPAQ